MAFDVGGSEGKGKSRPKPTINVTATRFEIVMVKRSLEAANAIMVGNSRSLIASVTMRIAVVGPAVDNRQTLRRVRLLFS